MLRMTNKFEFGLVNGIWQHPIIDGLVSDHLAASRGWFGQWSSTGHEWLTRRCFLKDFKFTPVNDTIVSSHIDNLPNNAAARSRFRWN
ncbi:hypothetical protein Bhyg_06475 [Pseudolycoriella hygida]|uniref:Uncharacterized protein n=1 Tax=Pseudolycoriella hygida TaxID=35572 RepID=A0A9Q0N1G0_9DIPT|nr:hypothetical protein Bhyg_06475 [Pseudolycoriella hygida]